MTTMALNPWNSSNVEHRALKGVNAGRDDILGPSNSKVAWTGFSLHQRRRFIGVFVLLKYSCLLDVDKHSSS